MIYNELIWFLNNELKQNKTKICLGACARKADVSAHVGVENNI